MPGIETRSNLPRALWPGVKRWTGIEYREHPKFYDKIFDMQGSDQAFEEDVELSGFGLAHVKPEGEALKYDGLSQGPTSRYVHVAYALGFIVTREAFADNRYERVAQFRSKALARSFIATKETVAANVLNRGFNGSYLGGDGQPLLSNAHPTRAGNQSNILPVAADFSETAVEDLVKLMAAAKGPTGLPIVVTPRRLVVGTDYLFEVERLSKSVQRVGTPNNDVNALRSMGFFDQGPIMNPYLSDADAWFVLTNVDGLTGYNREAYDVERDNDFDTKNLKVSGYERYSFGWSDFRAAYGSPGA